MISALACDDDPTRSDPDVEPLVGDWEATSMVVTSRGDPPLSADLVPLGARFFLNVQPSGQYTSSVTFLGATVVELGDVRIEGDRLVFDVEVSPTGARVDTTSFTLDDDLLSFDGDATVDFGDGEGPQEADMEVTMIRVSDGNEEGGLRAEVRGRAPGIPAFHATSTPAPPDATAPVAPVATTTETGRR